MTNQGGSSKSWPNLTILPHYFVRFGAIDGHFGSVVNPDGAL
jgi:hypothetical protein